MGDESDGISAYKGVENKSGRSLYFEFLEYVSSQISDRNLDVVAKMYSMRNVMEHWAATLNYVESGKLDLTRRMDCVFPRGVNVVDSSLTNKSDLVPEVLGKLCYLFGKDLRSWEGITPVKADASYYDLIKQIGSPDNVGNLVKQGHIPNIENRVDDISLMNLWGE
jgi:hypothetical protein